METGQPPGCAPAAHVGRVAAGRTEVRAPLTAVYVVPAAAATREPAAFHLAVPPPLFAKETLPYLTLHLAGGLQPPPGLILASAPPAPPPAPSAAAAAAAAPPPAARAKSAGKHLCPHCGRDCMKPSVLEKHLRCHTGERPYPCATCGVSFKTQSNLYKHKRTQAHARLFSSSSSESEQGSVDSASGSREAEASEMEVASGEGAKVRRVEEREAPPPAAGRHLPLQRQKAAVFSALWDASASRGKSQSHESTDSGFSESGDLLCGGGTDSPPGKPPAEAEPRSPPLRSLEERISRLISENSAVVEDKHLENVRPRKTVLSKQGSIDLPTPYTFKDSFHFDMRIGARRPAGLSSMPTQNSSSSGVDHAPLTRSTSLPFCVALLQQPEVGPASARRADDVSLVGRGSSGPVKPAGSAVQAAPQQPAAHRALVRQAAVDCNHAAAGEEPEGARPEPGNRKLRRKKAQKFAYSKWYMYGGGTFKKLYDTESDPPENKGRKGSNPEEEGPRKVVHGETTTTDKPPKLHLGNSLDFNLRSNPLYATRPTFQKHLSVSALPVTSTPLIGQRTEEAGTSSPSLRKKLRTDDQMFRAGTQTPQVRPPHQDQNLNHPDLQINQKQDRAQLPPCSFLPKYQLKLPHCAEPDAGTAPTKPEPTCSSPPLADPERERRVLPASASIPMGEFKKTAARIDHGATASLTVSHKQFPTTTVTTASCRRDSPAGLCSTLMGSSGPPRHLTPGARVHCGSDPAEAPCRAAPPDRVFHVHTADLQICLQIISDEQLALIQPQMPEESLPTMHLDKIKPLDNNSPAAGGPKVLPLGARGLADTEDLRLESARTGRGGASDEEGPLPANPGARRQCFSQRSNGDVPGSQRSEIDLSEAAKPAETPNPRQRELRDGTGPQEDPGDPLDEVTSCGTWEEKPRESSAVCATSSGSVEDHRGRAGGAATPEDGGGPAGDPVPGRRGHGGSRSGGSPEADDDDDGAVDSCKNSQHPLGHRPQGASGMCDDPQPVLRAAAGSSEDKNNNDIDVHRPPSQRVFVSQPRRESGRQRTHNSRRCDSRQLPRTQNDAVDAHGGQVPPRAAGEDAGGAAAEDGGVAKARGDTQPEAAEDFDITYPSFFLHGLHADVSPSRAAQQDFSGEDGGGGGGGSSDDDDEGKLNIELKELNTKAE